MYDLAVFIYEDESLKKTIGSYRTSFTVFPRVGDFIGKHVRIDGSRNCRVEQVLIIPRDNLETTDADAIIKAVAVEKDLLP